MVAGSWLLGVAGWGSILGGVALTLLGLSLAAAMFSGGGAPLGGALIFFLLIFVAGPLLVLGGPAVIFAGVKLMSGHAWARLALEIFWWTMLVGTTGYLVYRAFTEREILTEDVLTGAFYFLCTGAPSIVMVVLLRSDSIRRAMVR